MTKKEPPLIRVHLNIPDAVGQDVWHECQLALEDPIVNAIKDLTGGAVEAATKKAVELSATKFDKMRLKAYEDFTKTMIRFEVQYNLSFNSWPVKHRRPVRMADCGVAHPDAWTELHVRLEEINRMEKAANESGE